METHRKCIRCNVRKELDKFRRYQSGRRLRRECMDCEKVDAEVRRSKNSPERLEQMRQGNFFRKYGITIEQYDQMVADRQGRCDICRKLPKDNRGSKLFVDHVEGTKIVRGLLCLKCNVGIGMLQHSRPIVKAAYHYLKG